MPEAKELEESAELEQWKGAGRRLLICLWVGVGLGAVALIAGSFMTIRSCFTGQSDEAEAGLLAVCLGVLYMTLMFMWMSVQKWREVVVEQRIAFEQARADWENQKAADRVVFQQAQITWENERAELIATACQTVMGALRTEQQESARQDASHLRLVKPHNEMKRNNEAG